MYLLSMSMANSIQLISPPLKPMQLKEDRESQGNVVVSSKEEKEARIVVDDDDGYHTPTSPKHRIPTAIECPPAPKKPAIRRFKKRKACCLVEIKDVEFLFCAEIDEGKKSKKAREEVASK